MSYILDALKKAERERHLTKIPTVNTVHRISWDRQRPIWLWIAGAAVLANAAVLIWLLRPEPARDKGTPSPPVASAPMAAAPEKPPILVERPAVRELLRNPRPSPMMPRARQRFRLPRRRHRP